MGRALRVFLADDHPIYRQGIARFLENEGEVEVCGYAENGKVALERIQELQPDVAVLDISMPEMTGLEVVDALGDRVKIILLTGSDEKDMIHAAFSSGAAGYLLKNADWEDLFNAIKKVAAGGTVVAEDVVATFRSNLRRQDGVAAPLTDKEIEVMNLVAKGESIAIIAKDLAVGQTTVKTHLQHIFSKLGVTNQPSAVAEAMRQGLIR